MSKQEKTAPDKAPKTPEKPHTPATSEKAPDKGAPHAPHAAASKKADASPRDKRGKVDALPGHCCAEGCKAKEVRFNFCNEHFEHFKFGLLKKSGEPVPDYEKKIEHYQAYVARLRAQKAA